MAEQRVIYDSPSRPPDESLHWKRVLGDSIPKEQELFSTHEELIVAFQSDVYSFNSCTKKESYIKIAFWSCIIGYCEALSTHKDEGRRYSIYPVPLAGIRRLVDEFVELVHSGSAGKQAVSNSVHRSTVQTVSNSIWKRAQNKSQMKDELHANSLYICLCGDLDNKSLDCFGAALLTSMGMNILGFGSLLTLSEDHAYESHYEGDADEETSAAVITDGTVSSDSKAPTYSKRATCEVAIPGNTKASQSKRGREIAATFADLKSTITPETSWLYMADNAVVCDTPGMVLAAMLGNVNCDVEKVKKTSNNDGKPQVVSSALCKIKRDMLWILYDGGHMTKFPFALMELGECEEHFGSERGMKWVEVGDLIRNQDEDENKLGVQTWVLWNEKLFLDAINVSRTAYNDAQVYPYLYAGHYHKDAGRKSPSDEYRLVEALRLYSEASRVASKYKYETKDCMQLMKHMTTVSSLIMKDFLLCPSAGHDNKAVRVWVHRENAVAAATFVLAFYDSLLFWEEKEETNFVEILGLSHKHFLGKLFQYFALDVRVDALAEVYKTEMQHTAHSVITKEEMLYFRQPRSKRLAQNSLLIAALLEEKIVVKEIDIALPSVGSRQRKRARNNQT